MINIIMFLIATLLALFVLACVIAAIGVIVMIVVSFFRSMRNIE